MSRIFDLARVHQEPSGGMNYLATFHSSIRLKARRVHEMRIPSGAMLFSDME